MSTTLEMFADAKRGNYCTLPTIDVEILPDVHHCKTCDEQLVYDPNGGSYGMGEWLHADPTIPKAAHYVSPKVRCRYCHSEDDAVYRQHAWHDAVECSRCGGIDGYAIGD